MRGLYFIMLRYVVKFDLATIFRKLCLFSAANEKLTLESSDISIVGHERTGKVLVQYVGHNTVCFSFCCFLFIDACSCFTERWKSLLYFYIRSKDSRPSGIISTSFYNEMCQCFRSLGQFVAWYGCPKSPLKIANISCSSHHPSTNTEHEKRLWISSYRNWPSCRSHAWTRNVSNQSPTCTILIYNQIRKILSLIVYWETFRAAMETPDQ